MDTNVAEILEALARSQPAAPAIHVPGRTTLTFLDLGEQIRYVRERFRGWEIASGDVVAGVIPTRPEMAVACATIPASAAFAPLSPALTVEAYAELLARLRPKAAIVPMETRHPMRVAAERCGVAEITLAGDLSRPAGMFSLDLARHDESLRLPATVGRDIAHVMCTSGTTGRAKLVPIAHRRSALFSKAFGDWSGLTAHDVGCHLSPFHHGHGLNSALMVPLLRGSSIVCLPESDIEVFYHALDTYRPTWLTAVFTIHKAILRRAAEHRDVVDRSQFRFFKVGSGALDSCEIDQLEQLFRAPVLSALIAQEVFLVTHDPLPPRVRKHGSVGLPVCNDVALFGDGGAWCRPGDIGEIVVRGPTVFEGYLDDPQATAAAFVDGWCRTGDLGRFDDDGYLFMEGRVKDLIHRGGEKFAPVQIDRAIEALAGVRAAAAFGVPHPTLGEEVAAAVVRDADAAIDEAQIIEHVRQRLGPKGAPRAVYFVDDLPRTDSGKVRRSELSRLLGLDRPATSPPADSVLDTPAQSLSPLEAGLASLWSTVLQLKSLGATDDFFLLGGDSLRGVRLLAGVKALCGVELTLELLLGDAATIAGMARAIEAVRSGAAGKERAGDTDSARIPRRQESGAAILSDTQRRMWFLARLDPSSVAYNESRAHRLTGEIDPGAFERSVRYLVRRHEILRTTYVLIDDEPRQVVQDESLIDVQTLDLSATPAEQQDQGLHRLLRAWMSKPFDHESGPVLRCVLVRLGDREHVLLRVWHHIVSDAWSISVFDRELSAAYGAFVKGREPKLSPLPVQYADYALWQRERVQGEVLERQLAYWKRQLDGVAILELPTDRARPPVPSHQGAHLAFELPVQLTRALKELGRREGATLFMTLLAAYQVLLYRYSGQEDIAVGTPIAGRGHPDLDGLIGFFANTLVLRSDLSGNPSFRDLLARVRGMALEAYAHQDVPFEKLVEDLAPARDLSRNPLFQANFNLQNVSGASLAFHGVVVDQVPLEGQTAKFDLTLSVRESPAGLRASWNYASDLFDAPTIARMAGHFQVLLEAIVADPEQSVGQLPLLTEAERRQLLITWNDTTTDYPRDSCAHQLFEDQVVRTPDAVAVVYEDRQLTYAELNARANRLAHRLVALGVGSDVLVGLCTVRSLEMAIGLLGILKAGGAYVPFDPNWPSDRARLVMEDARLAAMVVQQAHGDRVPSGIVPLVFIEAHPESGEARAESNPDVPVSPANLVYVLYTSGTTGLPKGVLVEHRQLVQYVWAVADRLDLDGRGSYAMLQPLTVDACQTMIFPALGRGGTLHLISEARALDATKLTEYVRDHRVDYLKIAPSHLAALLDQLPSAVLLPERALVIGGEASHWDFLERLWSLPSRCAIWNHYGPTETTVGVSACRLSPADSRVAKTAPIGRPLANVQYYVLDDRLEPVPVGLPGELCIGGEQVARGYLNRPESTADRFVPDPFSRTPLARMYRSGDQVRYLADGQIEFLGRKDQQVKIRGFRIELGEIETVLRDAKGVREAVVSVADAAVGGKRLVAFVVADEDAAVDDRGLRASLATRLPDYMVPSQFVRLQQLPRTPHGKLDRKALVAPEAAACAFDAPMGEIETTLAQIWADVLKLERVGRRDNFFELGGHSLLAVTMLERMRRAGLHADVRALFVTPTLAELAAAVAADNRSVEVPANRIPPACTAITPDMLPLVRLGAGDIERITATVGGGAANVQDIYPLAPLQEGILFHHQMSTEGDPYSSFTMLAFDTQARMQRYLGALQAVIDRHDVLRSALLWEGLPEPVQVVWRRAPLVVEEVNFAGEGDVAQQLRSRFDPRHYRLDLRRAPIMRVFIAHDAVNARWIMLRVSHHVVSDHTSSDVVRHEIEAHLLGQADQLAAPLPFRDFVAQAKLGVSAEEHRRFFQNMLGDVDEPTTPFGLTDVHGGGSGIVEAERPLDASLARRLRARAREIGVSAASVCHLAWAQVLARASGRDDVVFGTVLFGRMQGGSGADRVLGLFINTLPLRIRVGDKGAQDSVRDTHTLLAQLLSHEHAPLALAQRCSAVPAPTPLFNALLNYRHHTAANEASAATRKAFEGIVSLPGHGGRTNYPLKMAITDQGEGFVLSAQAQTPIDPQRICAFMHTALEQLIGALESAPTTPLRRIDVLPSSERARLPDPTMPIGTPAQPSVVTQVLGWAHAAQDRIAVRAAGEQWTYAELTRRATSLATDLQGVGVGRGDVVAIIGPPGFGFVGAMLGVLMSGGAFLTIDPTLPTRRKQVMLAEARAKVVCLIGQSNNGEDYLETDDTLAVLRTDLELTSHVGSTARSEKPWSPPTIHGDDPAYVFFTSGSTGQPKAILGCHKGLSHFLQWQRVTFAIGTDDRVSQLIGLTFDALLRDVFLPLTSGATLCVPTDSDRLDTIGWLQREGVTVVHTTPTVMQSWLLDGERRLELPSLRWLFVSGEPLTDVLVGRWRRIVSGPTQVVNFYGPTETTMIRCFYIIPAELTPGVQPIGVSLPDSQALVLNTAGMLCGIGEIGEIVLRTPFRSLGYLNLPEETLRRFRPNPFRDDASDLLYFTGDLGRYRPDGLLEIAGRVDDQVKIRGVRIDPGEVTATLARHEAVRQCVVVGRDDAHGQPQLVGYVVPEAGKHVDARVLRVFLSGQLPQAFVPSTFVILDALPVLPNGKIDREALPSPDFGLEEDRGMGEPPRDALEELIAEVWREVLRVEQVGVHDNFFELGGHSLLATQVVARLSRLLQVELPLRRIFEAPTIAELAADVGSLGSRCDGSALEKILRELEALTNEETA